MAKAVVADFDGTIKIDRKIVTNAELAARASDKMERLAIISKVEKTKLTDGDKQVIESVVRSG